MTSLLYLILSSALFCCAICIIGMVHVAARETFKKPVKKGNTMKPPILVTRLCGASYCVRIGDRKLYVGEDDLREIARQIQEIIPNAEDTLHFIVKNYVEYDTFQN